jgi:hypothetical protein
MQRMKIEYVELAKIKSWPTNPKLHDDKHIDQSLDRWGYNDPMVRDATTGQLVEGHGRLNRLIAKRDAGENPPSRIDANARDWLAPVITIPFKNQTEAEAYLIAHNRLVESGGWDDDALLDMLAEHTEALDGIGFDDEELTALLESREQIRERDSGDIVDGDAQSEWVGMPEYHQPDMKPHRSIKVHFECQADVELFETLIKQKLPDLPYLWFPKKEHEIFTDRQWVSE